VGQYYPTSRPCPKRHGLIKNSMSRSNNWSFTINNYTEDELLACSRAVPQKDAVYIVFQEEVAPTTGTPHIQGYISFDKRIRLTGVKKVLGKRIYAVPSNGSPSSNRTYCTDQTKDGAVEGSVREFGTIPEDPKERQGKRSDFEEFRHAVDEGLRCKKKARLQFPALTAKYPRWCYDVIADKKEIQVDDHPYRLWQQDLYDRLSQEPNDRTIIFVVDKVGNEGKTWFGKHYCKHHDDAQYLEPSKKADMAYALQDDLRVLFINVTRTVEANNIDYLYSFVESVKDGMVFSPKYESRTKYYSKVHVVVMMNQQPNETILSADRYQIITIK